MMPTALDQLAHEAIGQAPTVRLVNTWQLARWARFRGPDDSPVRYDQEDRNDVLRREYRSFANSYMWESARLRIAEITIPSVRAALLKDHDARLELTNPALSAAERAAGLQALEDDLLIELEPIVSGGVEV